MFVSGPVRGAPHGLRHTFASLLVALCEDPSYVMGQLGHTGAAFTLSVYAKSIKRRDGERDRLRALVKGEAVSIGQLLNAVEPTDSVPAG